MSVVELIIKVRSYITYIFRIMSCCVFVLHFSGISQNDSSDMHIYKNASLMTIKISKIKVAKHKY